MNIHADEFNIFFLNQADRDLGGNLSISVRLNLINKNPFVPTGSYGDNVIKFVIHDRVNKD